jgi:acid phosphatase type 7
LQWVSNSDDSAPIVLYGTERESVLRMSQRDLEFETQPDVVLKTGYSTTYRASDMCDEPATLIGSRYFRDPGFIHRVALDIVPNVRYYYRVGSFAGTFSEVESFVAPLEIGQAARQRHDRSSYIVFGDLDESSDADRSWTTISRIQHDIAAAAPGQFAAIIHIGDLGYALGAGYLWDQFGAMIQPVSKSIPYMVGLGNHEYVYASGGFHPAGGNYGSDSNGECGVPYAHRFVTPVRMENASAEISPFWYSFRSGRTTHIVISTEHDFRPGSEMFNWLEAELKLVDRRVSPWLFVYGHRPLYCSEDYPTDYRVTLMLREALEPLFARYAVDIYFSGHYHAYERTCRVYKGECMIDDSGTLHIMAGSAGREVDNARYMGKAWSRAAFQTYGYARLHIFNDTEATVEFVENHSGNVIDSVKLRTDHMWTKNVMVV